MAKLHTEYKTDKTQTNMPDPEHHLTLHAKSAIYLLQNSHEKEPKELPIDTNTLKFKRILNYRLNSTLYLDRTSTLASSEFRSNLIYFCSYYILSLTAVLSLICLLRYSDSLSSLHFQIHLVSVLILLVGCFSILITVQKNPGILIAQPAFLVLSYISYAYFIIADERILCRLTGESYSTKNQIFLNILLVTLCPMLRFVFFDSFFYVLCSTLPAIFGFLAFQLSIQPFFLYSTVGEVALVSIFLLIQIIETYRNDLRIKFMFWRQISEVDMNKKVVIDNEVKSPGPSSEVEHVLELCEKIRSKLKDVIKIIMYKDVKMTLKGLILDIEKIKWKSVHFNEPKLVFDKNIDEQDKEYIKQTCLVPPLSVNEGFVRSFTDMGRFETVPKVLHATSETVLYMFGSNWDFDVHSLADSLGSSVAIVGKFLFSRWSLNEIFAIPPQVTLKYFESMESAYKHNPYHNASHASDVLHSFIYFLMNSVLQEKISSLELLASVIATLGHDVGHPGVTNRFLINNKEDLALQYNDSSVLENMHCCTIFSIMKNVGCHILETLERKDWFTVRNLIISIVLGTDMAKHFEILGQFRARTLKLKDLEVNNFEDKKMVLVYAVKCADLGHSAKTTELHCRWSYLLAQELFAQGDLEKERFQPISMYCDRETTDIDKSQAGFVKNICIPLYEVWGFYLNSQKINETCIAQQHKNLKHWIDRSNFLKSSMKPFINSSTLFSPSD